MTASTPMRFLASAAALIAVEGCGRDDRPAHAAWRQGACQRSQWVKTKTFNVISMTGGEARFITNAPAVEICVQPVFYCASGKDGSTSCEGDPNAR